MIRGLICMVLLFGMLASCGVRKLDAPDYLDYYSTHKDDYSVKANFYSNNASLVYCPLEYLLAESLSDSISAKEVKELKTTLQKKANTAFTLQFNFSKGSLLAQSKAPKEQQMKFYAVDFKHNIKAISATGDTVVCNNYIFEANGNFGNSAFFNFEIPLKRELINKIVVNDPYLSDSLLEFDASKFRTATYPELKIK